MGDKEADISGEEDYDADVDNAEGAVEDDEGE
jgi:hypothetical protein